MAEKSKNKKKTVKPLPAYVVIPASLIAVFAIVVFVVFIVAPPDFGNGSEGDLSLTQSFEEESKGPEISLGEIKNDLKDVEYLDIIKLGKYGGNDIEWIAVEKTETEITLMAKNCLTAMAFNDSREAVEFKDSSLAEWLNGEFLDNSLPEIGEMIIADGDLKVSIPSAEDVKNYFEYDSWRVCDATDNAVSDGLKAENGKAMWWLSDNGSIDASACYVYYDGSVRENGFAVDYDEIGVRPIIKISI